MITTFAIGFYIGIALYSFFLLMKGETTEFVFKVYLAGTAFALAMLTVARL